jgi:hypothetical protein
VGDAGGHESLGASPSDELREIASSPSWRQLAVRCR